MKCHEGVKPARTIIVGSQKPYSIGLNLHVINSVGGKAMQNFLFGVIAPSCPHSRLFLEDRMTNAKISRLWVVEAKTFKDISTPSKTFSAPGLENHVA